MALTFEDEVIQMRRHIHMHPEVGENEFETAKFIEKKLDALNIKHKRIGRTGVIATIQSNSSKKTLALRADMDALPIEEKNKVKYKSQNPGVMHACGHDNHVAMMLGVAKLLSKVKLSGNVRFIFQPNEEKSDGAKNMILGGALKNPKVDAILATHVCPWIPSGKIGIKYDAMMAAVDKFTIEIKGLIAHGAYPHLGKDAIIATVDFINNVQTIISRELDPTESAVITFGKITGGSAYNVICNKVVLEGTVRTLNNTIRKQIQNSIFRKLKALEMAFNIKTKVNYESIGNPLINNSEIVEKCLKAGNEFYGKENVVILKKSSMGGEDFAEYLDKVPGNFIYIGTSKNKATSYPWHHCNFDVDEMAVARASRYIAYTTEQFLK